MAEVVTKALVKGRLHLITLFALSHFRGWGTRTMSSGSTQRVFQLKLDPLTGDSQWVVIEEGGDGDWGTENYQKPLLANTSYLDMLNDSQRNRAFREAIDKTINKPCHVLDIGAGTGLLSMMSARAMGSVGAKEGPDSEEGMVTACESYLPMVKLMRKVLRVNGFERKIKVFNKRSDELQAGMDLTSRADVLVSEILDSELLGEGLIPTLQHAHDSLLVENPETVPYRATIFGQLVESTFLMKLHNLQSNEAIASDGIHLSPKGLDSVICFKPQQYAMHCDAMEKEIELLSEPFKIFEFDFWKRPESRGETELQIKATSSGRIHAIVSWWILQLDREGKVFYSTAPKWIRFPVNTGSGDWCDHWKQCVWVVPGNGVSIVKDEDVYLHAVHFETSIAYHLKSQFQKTGAAPDGFDVGKFKLTLPLERIAIYGDTEWRLAMLTAINRALQRRVCSLCIVADDSLFLAVAAASLSKSLHVISLFPGLRDRGDQYLHAVANANGISTGRVKIHKGRTGLTMNDTHQKKVELFIGEPFYFGNDGALPWQNLRFWKERTTLNSVLNDDVSIVPSKGKLRACAMYLPDLWNSRCCLGKIEGFDHSVVNSTLGACGELPEPEESPCFPFNVWQCGEYKELSEIIEVLEFDFYKPISECSGKAQVMINRPGTCHGFVLWIDWVMDTENSIVISTGPDKRYWKQGVKLLSKPVSVGVHGSDNDECSHLLLEASFDPSNGELSIKHSFP